MVVASESGSVSVSKTAIMQADPDGDSDSDPAIPSRCNNAIKGEAAKKH